MVWLLGFVCPLRASADVERLYDASVVVANQGETERARALREALQQVVMRLSGQTDFSGNAAFQQALSNPEGYVRQFGYISSRDDAQASPAATASPPVLSIKAVFNPDALTALLHRAGLPVWPVNRPSILAWVAINAGGERQMLGQVPEASPLLDAEARRRGVALVMPMDDLNDQIALGGIDRLWDLDTVGLEEASRRYGEDSILAGHVEQTAPGTWQARWLYLLRGQSATVDTTAPTLDAALAAGIELAVQTQVARYGIGSDDRGGSRVVLSVSGVDRLSRYSAVLSLLGRIESIRSVKITGMEAGVLQCELDVTGDQQSLEDILSLGKILAIEPAKTPADATDNALFAHYAGP